MAELFTINNFKTLTHRGISDPKQSELVLWFNVDGKTNDDIHERTLLDHVNHKSFFNSVNTLAWKSFIFEEINGKTFMQYPSDEKGVIRKDFGVHNIREVDTTFVINTLPNGYATILTTQGAGVKSWGGITVWINDVNRLTISTIFQTSAGTLGYWQQSVGGLIEVGIEYNVNVRIDTTNKKVNVTVNGTLYSLDYDSTYSLFSPQPRELIIGSDQEDTKSFPVADFKIHEVKVYK